MTTEYEAIGSTWSVRCDGIGCHSQLGGTFATPTAAVMEAERAGWIHDEGTSYCPECVWDAIHGGVVVIDDAADEAVYVKIAE